MDLPAINSTHPRVSPISIDGGELIFVTLDENRRKIAVPGNCPEGERLSFFRTHTLPSRAFGCSKAVVAQVRIHLPTTTAVALGMRFSSELGAYNMGAGAYHGVFVHAITAVVPYNRVFCTTSSIAECTLACIHKSQSSLFFKIIVFGWVCL